MNYVRIHVEGEEYNYVTSETYYKQKFEGKDGVTLLDTFKGTDLEGLEYETCFPEIAEQNFAHSKEYLDEVLNTRREEYFSRIILELTESKAMESER